MYVHHYCLVKSHEYEKSLRKKLTLFSISEQMAFQCVCDVLPSNSLINKKEVIFSTMSPIVQCMQVIRCINLTPCPTLQLPLQ